MSKPKTYRKKPAYYEHRAACKPRLQGHQFFKGENTMSDLIDLEPGIYSNGMAEIELVRSLRRDEIPGLITLPGMWLAVTKDELFGTEQMVVTRCQLEQFGYERKQEEA